MHHLKFFYANNELTVVQPMSSVVRVKVFDLMGHLVEAYTEFVTGSKIFSLDHLNKGNYVLDIESDRLVRTLKIVVK